MRQIILALTYHITENHPNIHLQPPSTQKTLVLNYKERTARIHQWTSSPMNRSGMMLSYQVKPVYQTPASSNNTITHQLPDLEDPNFFPHLDQAIKQWKTS